MRTTADILENFEEETEKYLLAFCEKYNIENLTKAPQNTFEAAMSYVGERIFLKPDGVTLKYNRQTVIDCDNAALVNYILERYEQQCLIYNKEITIQGFAKYTKISEQTMYNWLNGEYKTKIYLDKDGNVIKDIQEWILNKRGEYTEVASTAHLDIVKKIRKMDEDSLASIGISDRNNTGVAMKLNSKYGWNSVTGKSAVDESKPRQSLEQITAEFAGLLPETEEE